ncbi:MAG: AMP-binding protein [Nannocystaceae bacterium]
MRGPPLRPPRFTHIGAALSAAGGGDDAGVTFVDLHEREERRSWRVVEARARLSADALYRAGIRPGDRVAIVVKVGPTFLDAFFGTCLAGAVPVVLAPPRRTRALDSWSRATGRMLMRTGARAVIAEAESARRIEALLPGQNAAQLHDAATLVERGTRAVHSSTPAPEALACVQFSSGTHSEPKAVALSHRSIMAQLAMLESSMEYGPSERRSMACWLPLNHDMGLFGHLLHAVYCAAPIVMAAPETFLARPSVMLRAVSRHRVTFMSSPNFFYALCTRRVADAELEGVDLSSWRFILNGAEPVAPAIVRAFGERFRPYGLDPERMMPVYGLAEATLAVTFAPPGRPTRSIAIDGAQLARTGEISPGTFEVASVGPPVAGVEVEVRDDDGRAVPARRVGHVWVRSPSVMLGYLGDPEATRSTLVQGWLNTGDLGFLDDGELTLCGRAKDVVIIRGANHVPEEFEACLDDMTNEGVRAGSAVAVGFVPQGAGEELLILAESRVDPPPSGLEAAIRTRVLERTGILPFGVVLFTRGALPKTTSGKRRRGEALRQLLAGEIIPTRSTVRIGPIH